MKLVRENLYNFQKTGDIKSDLNIGIRASIKNWLDEMYIKNYRINEDFSIDVNGNVELQYKELTEFPPFIKFGLVTGYFDCYNNNLKSLRGSPDEVNSGFNCEENELTSLEYSPRIVRGTFNCSNNKLTSLKGGPIRVNGDFACSQNPIISMEGAPKYVGGNFYFYYENFLNSYGDLYRDLRKICKIKGNIYSYESS